MFLQDNSVHVYTLNGDTLTEKKAFQAGKEVVAAEFSPDGATLAVSSGRSVLLFDSASYEVSLFIHLLPLSLALTLTAANQRSAVPHSEGDGHCLVSQLSLHCIRRY